MSFFFSDSFLKTEHCFLFKPQTQFLLDQIFTYLLNTFFLWYSKTEQYFIEYLVCKIHKHKVVAVYLTTV